ncbi:DMT family transporter [Oxalobacteraceae bacterium OM1]|nr:DMT family transporter [Oxalobacteraceae bacterium OM1]
MSERKPLDSSAMLLMLVLCVLWGLQQVAVKAAAPGMSPVLQLGVRSLIAAALVFAMVSVRGERIAMGGMLLPGIGAGVLFAVEFLCAGAGLKFTTASHMSVFLYTAPIFTVLGLHLFLPAERINWRQWLGVAAAFAGVATAFSNGFATDGRDLGDMLLGDFLGVLGGLFWAATTVLIRCSALSEAPPATTLFYQLAGCGVLLTGIGAVNQDFARVDMTPLVWGSLFFQSVVVAFLSYLAWFWMLRRYLASRVTVFSFLTPLFGVAFGVLLLGDAIDARFAVGALLVLAGVVMVNFR